MTLKKDEQKEQEQQFKKFVPVDSNNEQFILGQAINNPKMLDVLFQEVAKTDFLYVNHQAIYEALEYLLSEGLEVNIDAIDAVKTRFDFGTKVNIEYLNQLKTTFKESVDAQNYKFHTDKLKRDKVSDLLQTKMVPDFYNKLQDPKTSIESIMESLEEMETIVKERATNSSFKFNHSRITDTKHTQILKERESSSVFGRTGYSRLDKVMTDGFSPKKITIVAGRPGMAKSALVANILLRLATYGIPVALYNFEMDDVSMYDRLVAIQANIPIEQLIKDRNKLSKEDREAETKAKRLISNLPLYFYTASTQTIAGVQRDLKILKEKFNVHLVVYDLFKKMKLKSRYNSSTADMLSENLDAIQAMGKELEIHQILVVQIGRKAETRRDKRPRLSDLKDSGGYEEVADNVILLYRQAYYDTASELTDDMQLTRDDAQDLELILAKQRQGQANQKVVLDFFPVTTSIMHPILEQ